MAKPNTKEGVAGLVSDLVHNQRSHDEARKRRLERTPPGPLHLCNRCGKASNFSGTDKAVTSMLWCEPCYDLLLGQLKHHERHVAPKSGLARHLMRQHKPR